jgi:hypothetical protein
MSNQLTLYNLALLYCGERALSSLTESREPRRTLDEVWNANGVKKCLEEGQWRFARRSVQIDYDPDITPQFGFGRAFPKPSDYVVTVAMCQDEYFREPLLRYSDEAGHWYSDLDVMYVTYVSSDDGYGLNINDWPGWFEEFVAAHFASRIIWKLSASEDKLKTITALRQSLKKTALNRDAMSDPTKFPAPGGWVRARHRQGSSRDRGNLSGDLY